VKACDICGIDDPDLIYTQSGNDWLCSVHTCEECKEPAYARRGGHIWCDSCYIAEGEGYQCQQCGEIEHVDLMVGTICQGCDDQAGFYGGI